MSLQSALSARLAADGPGLCRLAADFVLDRPVGAFVNPERLDFWLDHAFDEGALHAAVEAHVQGFVEREQARAKARGDRVRDWISPEAQAELRAFAARPVVFERATLERWVDQDAVRTILQSIVRETLDRFIDTVRPGGSGGGLVGAVGRRTIGLASRAGRGLLGGLGGQVEELLRGAVSSFVSGSMGLMVDRFVGILMQPETQRQLGRLRLSAYEQAMKSETAVIFDQVAAEPALEDLLEALPGLLAHNLDRGEVRALIREEAQRWVEAEGARAIRDFLPAENIAALRDELAALVLPMVVEFVGSAGFAAWADAEAGAPTDASAAVESDVEAADGMGALADATAAETTEAEADARTAEAEPPDEGR